MLLHSKTYANSLRIPEDYGCRHLKFKFQNEPVDVLVFSKNGEHRTAKPLLFFCQEPLARPLLCYDAKGMHPVFPFEEHLLLDVFHIAIAAPPFVPVLADAVTLSAELIFSKPPGNQPPKLFLERNHLDYYAFRNSFLLRQFSKERWVKSKKLVVAGWAEGSAIALKMALSNPKITQLIYAKANPYGTIAGVLSACGQNGTQTIIENWKNGLEQARQGHSGKGAYDFALPQYLKLLQLTVPVLVHYPGQDCHTAFNELLQVEALVAGCRHFSFKNSGASANPGQIASEWLQWLSLPQ